MTSLLKAFDDVQIEVHNTFLRFRRVNEKNSDISLKPSEPCMIPQVITQEKSAKTSSKGEESSELFTIDEEKTNNIKLLSADAPEFHFQDSGLVYTQTWEERNGYLNDSFPYTDSYYPEWLDYDNAGLGNNSPTPSTCEDDLYSSKLYQSDSRAQWWSEVSAPEQAPAPPTNTTVMIRNIPSKLMQNDMIKIIDDMGFFQRYDFFYAPINFDTMGNKGYCFVNLRTTEDAMELIERLDNKKLPVSSTSSRTNKVCRADWARIQGLQCNLEHFRTSGINDSNVSDDLKPAVFDLSGNRVGLPSPDAAPLVPFSEGDTVYYDYYETATGPCRRGQGAFFPSKLESVWGEPSPFHDDPSPSYYSCEPLGSSTRRSGMSGVGKVMVAGMSTSTTVSSLHLFMSAFGPVKQVCLVRDKVTHQHKGYGFCEFVNLEDAQKALGCSTDPSASWSRPPGFVLDGKAVVIKPYRSNRITAC